MINLANAFDWFTIYDRIDDWLAFYQKGQAAWYDVDFERYLVRNVTRCSTTKSLGEAIQEWGIESALLIQCLRTRCFFHSAFREIRRSRSLWVTLDI